jgi:hypothetical protein
MERARAGGRPHPQPVLRHLGQRDHAPLQQRRHAAGEHLVQPGFVVDPKIRQGVRVHPHPTAQPAIGNVLPTQPIQHPRRTDPVDDRQQPQRNQNLGIGRRPARPPACRASGSPPAAGPNPTHRRTPAPNAQDGPDPAGHPMRLAKPTAGPPAATVALPPPRPPDRRHPQDQTSDIAASPPCTRSDPPQADHPRQQETFPGSAPWPCF